MSAVLRPLGEDAHQSGNKRARVLLLEPVLILESWTAGFSNCRHRTVKQSFHALAVRNSSR
jgi:hypothetical protein